jgi:hypothetical protein
VSLNVTVATPEFVACATDRRLTSKNGVHSERSSKLVQFFCRTARGIITYNGIGCDRDGVTPSEWLHEIQELDKLDLMALAGEIAKILDERSSKLAADFGGNPRHTFVISAYEAGVPIIGMISNYESIDGNAALSQARKNATVEMLSATKPAAYVAIVTGATNIVRARSKKELFDALTKHGSRDEILRRMKKVIRDTAYVDRIKGSVGSSITFSYADRDSGFVCGTDVVGGSEIFEMPGMISPGFSVKDSWVASGIDHEKLSKLSPGKKGLVEEKCNACGTPVPAGYRICGACDSPTGTS